MKKSFTAWLQQHTAGFTRRQWISAIILFSLTWSLVSGWCIYHSFYQPAAISIEHLHPPLLRSNDSLLLLEKIYHQKHQ